MRCAKCRHSWFQEPPEIELPAEAAASAPDAAASPPPPAPAPAPSPAPPRFVTEPVAAAPAAQWDEPPEAEPEPEAVPVPPPAYDEPPAYAEPVGEEDALDEDDASQFEAAPPFRRRRNFLRLMTWAALIFALLAAGLIAAVSYWGVPDWVPIKRPTFALAPSSLALDFPAADQERRQLPNGTEYFGASGSITNTGASTQTVPPILVVLRDARDRIVYSFEVQPPKRSLAPGETVSVNEAVTDVPRSARVAEIGWKPS